MWCPFFNITCTCDLSGLGFLIDCAAVKSAMKLFCFLVLGYTFLYAVEIKLGDLLNLLSVHVYKIAPLYSSVPEEHVHFHDKHMVIQNSYGLCTPKVYFKWVGW